MDHDDATSWPTIPRKQIDEYIYELLLKKIVSQEFAPGQKLPSVDEMASALRVSRTPVTEAVNRLAVEGLLYVVPRKGTFVSDVTPTTIKELFDVRLMMELHAAMRALERVTDEEIAELQQLVSSLGRFVEDGRYTDFEAFLALDSQFHLAMVQLAGNSLLLRQYEGINLHLMVVRAYHRAPGAGAEAGPTQEEHLRIMSALQKRDAKSLEEALTAHILNRERQFIAALIGEAKDR